MMTLEIKSVENIPALYRDTPVGALLKYHNLDHEHLPYNNADLLIGMCMDNRKHLRIPENFAFILRAGGANLRYSEFKVSYAIAVGNVRCLVLVGHTQCGMVNIQSRKDQFIRGLVENAGWTPEQAEEHFDEFTQIFEIQNEVEFVTKEVERLRRRYPKILIAPMIYRVEDNLLYLI